MTLVVEVQTAAAASGIPPADQLERWARAAWDGASGDAEVVIRVAGEAESRQLNRDYRHQDRPTNVLSFPFEPPPGVACNHLGDLVICAPVVAREAAAQGKAAAAHWAHMVVHGMLHLQGHDHQADDEAQRMEARETEILTALGFPAPYPDEETQ